MRARESDSAVWASRIGDWCEQGLTTRAQLASVAGMDQSTIARWAQGQRGPDRNAVIAWRDSFALPAVIRSQCASVLTAEAAPVADVDLDVNGDGKVDLNDAEDVSVKIVADEAAIMETTRAVCAGRVDRETGLAKVERLNTHVQLSVGLAREIIARINEGPSIFSPSSPTPRRGVPTAAPASSRRNP